MAESCSSIAKCRTLAPNKVGTCSTVQGLAGLKIMRHVEGYFWHEEIINMHWNLKTPSANKVEAACRRQLGLDWPMEDQLHCKS